MGKSGFALVIAFGLMAFILLLLVSLTLFLQVETQSAAVSAEINLARQNALLGVGVALGELQRHTGPDRSITARAAILETGDPADAPVSHPEWTGVWTGGENGPAISWLVSGNAGRLASAPDYLRPDSAAAESVVSGAFNVNSTSEAACKSFLAGNDGRLLNGSPLEYPFFRLFENRSNPPGNGRVEAHCEVTVQRIYEYVDPIDVVTLDPGELSSQVNRDFGRRYEIVAFRWLSPEG